MDSYNLMGLLGGDPQTTGGSIPATTSAPAPTYSGGDPETNFYGGLGLDPALIEQQRWKTLGDYGMAAMIAGAPGVTADTAIQYLQGIDPNKGMKEMFAAKRTATDMALDKAKLNLSQQEMLMRQRAEAREQALNDALGLSLSPYSGETVSPGVSAVPSIAQAAGIRAPARFPGGNGIPTADLPGLDGNPRLDVHGTGQNQFVEPQAPQVSLSPSQSALVTPLNPLATARAVFQGDPTTIARLGISPEQAAMVRVLAASGPEGRKAAISQIMSLSEKSRYTSQGNDAGYVVSTDQYGHKSVIHAPTQAQTLALDQGRSDIQEMREMGTEQRAFARDRYKAGEDAARGEQIRAREAAMGVTNKGIEEAFKTATAAKDVLERTATAENLMRSGVFSGGQVAVSAGAAQAMLSRYGLWDNTLAEDRQARTVALQNLGREIALGLAKSMRPTTDKDMALAERIAGLTPDQYDVKTIREVLRISRIGHERTIAEYNAAADRARKPFEMSGDPRSLASADAAYPKLTIPSPAPQDAPASSATPAEAPVRKTINGRTFEHDGHGWYEVH